MSNVSHETNDRIAHFTNELRRWNTRINMIGRSTESDLVQRHIEDSRQVYELAPNFDQWCDLGSGGGFPGLIVAILSEQRGGHITLVESDKRKAAFLKHVVTTLDLNATVIAERIEECAPIGADVISARALAPLHRLLDLAVLHGTPETRYLFPKGERFQAELDEVRADWRFSLDMIPSKTAPNAVILSIRNLSRARSS